MTEAGNYSPETSAQNASPKTADRAVVSCRGRVLPGTCLKSVKRDCPLAMHLKLAEAHGILCGENRREDKSQDSVERGLTSARFCWLADW